MKYFKVYKIDVLSPWTGMIIRKQATLWGTPIEVEGAYEFYKVCRKGRYKGMQYKPKIK